MSNKRMFSKDVVRTDRFLDMPSSTRELYFHLNLDADVKGFVSPKSVMRLIGATDDDLSVLIAKGYVIPFASGVIVVTHWNVNNQIRETHEAPTQFMEEFRHLEKTDHGTYLLPDNYSSPTVELPRRIDKDRLGKNRIDTPKPKEKKAKGLDFTDDKLKEFQLKFPTKNVREEYNTAVDWLLSTGRTYKDYEAFFRNWLRRAEAKVVAPAPRSFSREVPFNQGNINKLKNMKEEYGL